MGYVIRPVLLPKRLVVAEDPAREGIRGVRCPTHIL